MTVDREELIIALESRKRLIKTDCVCNPGKYAYAVLWTEILAVLREMTGGDTVDAKTAEKGQ